MQLSKFVNSVKYPRGLWQSELNAYVSLIDSVAETEIPELLESVVKTLHPAEIVGRAPAARGRRPRRNASHR